MWYTLPEALFHLFGVVAEVSLMPEVKERGDEASCDVIWGGDWTKIRASDLSTYYLDEESEYGQKILADRAIAEEAAKGLTKYIFGLAG